MLSQSRRASNDPSAALVEQLLASVVSTQSADLGFAGSAGRAADVESTAWVLTGASLLPALALHREGARHWLLQQQQANGSWAFRRGPVMGTWPTFPALFALSIDGASGSARARARAWLAQEHSVTPSLWQRLLLHFSTPARPTAEPPVVLDATLDGFGWASSTFAWVEPTAMAMMALAVQAPEAATVARVAIGARMLIDRQSSDGGWNYGNKRVLGVDLPGYPDTTGWALLGLAAAVRMGSASPPDIASASARGFAYINAPQAQVVTPLPLALALLANAAHASPRGTSRKSAVEQLETSLATALAGARDGFPMLDTRTAVLALMALSNVNLMGNTTP